MQFYRLKVAEVIRETKEAVSIIFDLPEELKDKFAFKQGQYLTLRIYINGEEYRRSYSLSSSPALNEPLVVTAKRTQHGVVSTYINTTLKAGDEIEVMPPLGKFFTELNPESSKTYVMIGGGSGITPLMSNLKTILSKESKSNIILLYGNRDEECVIYKKSLDELAAESEGRLKIIYVYENPADEKSGVKGILTGSTIMDLVRAELSGDEILKAEYMMCGPAVMMEGAVQILTDNNVPDKQIHREFFTAPLVKEPEVVGDSEDNDEDGEEKDREVTVIISGEEHVINVKAGQYILDAAMNAGLDPPYSCRQGICTTCRGMLHSGKVKMDEQEGLSEQEIEEGFILTCQAHPLTDNVKVEYDL